MRAAVTMAWSMFALAIMWIDIRGGGGVSGSGIHVLEIVENNQNTGVT